MRTPIPLLVLFLLFTCALVRAQAPLFQQVPSSTTGVAFQNVLKETPTSNVLTYEYFYNGGGSAIGDINNDGLEDIYFTANMGANKLYLNEGNFKFRDITQSSGTACEDGWKTGVTMADVNGDGNLDIYVCYSGKGDPEKRRNKLFINNGDLTFSEQARAVGLDDPGHTTHASFFDYDRDGDLDMYLLNHNVVVIREFEFAKAKATRHPYAGDKLFRNDGGKFTDVSAAAGIKGSPLGFGLGLSVADINKDGWLDIYVANDYIEQDYVYINNGNGTFTDRMTEYMQHISYFSMGCDVNDINNDALPDIFTVDMLPEDNERQKLLYGPENYEHFALMVLNGFYFQNMRNMLHLNNGDGTYSEIGQFAGVSNTDWSWAPLFADYDNDGWKDLFITNGYYRDYTNRDFLKYKGDYYFEKGKVKEKADTFHLVSTMTSTPVHNYIFRNNRDLTFSDKSAEWGFSEKNFSNGAAHGDLDNDGDLDLIVNHQNEVASVYKNTSRETSKESNFLQLLLTGNSKNSRAIGAKITVYAGGDIQYLENISTRGFQSSVSGRIHIGLGKRAVVDSLTIAWPDGSVQRETNVKANQLVRIAQDSSGAPGKTEIQKNSPVFKEEPIINFTHAEQGFNDFKRQPLLTSMLTPCGPVIATGDLNGDGLSDAFVGGTEGNPGRVFLQNKSGLFEPTKDVFSDKFTDADALFVDIDSDKDPDLYIVSGGYNDYKPKDKTLQDRVYLNDGAGHFTATAALPEMFVSKSCVSATDFDHDNDPDLFVGGRVIPGRYPETPESFLLRNTGGKFENVTSKSAKLSSIGMVTDAKWVDLNKDGWEDLVVVGEFMGIEVFLNDKGKKLELRTRQFFDKPLKGLWNTILGFDFDKDGDEDFIVGNFGLNSQLKASPSQPLALFYKDFDKNGSVDPILTYFIQGKPYPFASRDELLDQIYSMRSKYTSYASYANANLKTIFSETDLQDASELKATELRTIFLENREGKLVVRALPAQAQFSPVYATTLVDYNKDGNMDVILSGNQSSIRIRMGVIDANFGQLLEGDGKGNFRYVKQTESGLKITGDTKSLQMVSTPAGEYLMTGINNVGIQTFKLNNR